MSGQTRQEVNELVEQYLTDKYQFRYNCVMNTLEFKKANEGRYTLLTDYLVNSIRRELTHVGISVSIADLRSLLNSDFTPSYNPFEDYFKELPKWSQTDGDFIAELASKVETTNNDLWMKCFRKWIVALVACALNPETVNQTAIIFTGAQGIGKTTFLFNLVPKKLREYYFEGTINPGNKDTLAHLSECLFINLDELENLTRADAGALKEIITKCSIRMRRPYGSINESMPRRASFCGSVNNKEFLNDTTGNRRFLCFEALYFHNDVLVDLDGVYAQAYYLWKKGFQFWFDKREIEEVNEHNREYRITSQEEEALLSNYEPVKEDDEGCELLQTSDIHRRLMVLSKLPNTSASVNHLGKALHSHKFPHRKRNQRQVWLVKRLIDDSSMIKERPS